MPVADGADCPFDTDSSSDKSTSCHSVSVQSSRSLENSSRMSSPGLTVRYLFDDHGRGVDHRFLEINPAFERHTGLVGAVGKTARQLVPDVCVFCVAENLIAEKRKT